MLILKQLSAKTNSLGKSEIMLRVAVNRTFRPRIKTNLFIEPKCWLTKSDLEKIVAIHQKKEDEKAARRTTKNSKGYNKGELTPPAEPEIIDMWGWRSYIDTGGIHDKSFRPSPEVEQTNKRLNNLVVRIERWSQEIPQDLTNEELKVRFEKLVSDFKLAPDLNPENKIDTLLAIIDHYIEEVLPSKKKRNGEGVSTKTILHYRQARKHLADFIRDRCNGIDLPLCRVDKSFYDNFIDYINTEKGFSANTVGKYLKDIKAAINARPPKEKKDCELVNNRDCVNIRSEVESIYLSEVELQKLEDCNITTPYLSRVRDQFLLLAWTGCRYSDLGKLTPANISADGRFFVLRQQKTANVVNIPILPAVERILAKYAGGHLPKVMPSQPFNRYLKEACRLAEINGKVILHGIRGGQRIEEEKERWECVSAHTARRSFCTNMSRRGIPSTFIRAISGHRSEAAFLAYLKQSQSERVEDFMTAFNASERKED